MNLIEFFYLNPNILRISTRRQLKEQVHDHNSCAGYYGNSKVHGHIMEEKGLELFFRKKENVGGYFFLVWEVFSFYQEIKKNKTWPKKNKIRKW